MFERLKKVGEAYRERQIRNIILSYKTDNEIYKKFLLDNVALFAKIIRKRFQYERLPEDFQKFYPFINNRKILEIAYEISLMPCHYYYVFEMIFFTRDPDFVLEINKKLGRNTAEIFELISHKLYSSEKPEIIKQFIELSLNLSVYLHKDIFIRYYNKITNYNGHTINYSIKEISFILQILRISPNISQKIFLNISIPLIESLAPYLFTYGKEENTLSEKINPRFFINNLDIFIQIGELDIEDFWRILYYLFDSHLKLNTRENLLKFLELLKFAHNKYRIFKVIKLIINISCLAKYATFDEILNYKPRIKNVSIIGEIGILIGNGEGYFNGISNYIYSFIKSLEDIEVLIYIVKQGNLNQINKLDSLLQRFRLGKLSELLDFNILDEFIELLFYFNLALWAYDSFFNFLNRNFENNKIEAIRYTLLLFKEIHKKYPDSSFSEFLNHISQFEFLFLIRNKDDLINKLYLYKVDFLLEILNIFGRGNINIDENDAINFENNKDFIIKNHSILLILTRSGVINKISDLYTKNLNELIDTYIKTANIRSYENLSLVLFRINQNPESSHEFLKLLLINLKNTTFSSSGRQDIEAFLPTLRNTLNNLRDNYSKFSREDQVYLDAIFKRLSFGEQDFIMRVRGLAIDLAGACSPLMQYRQDIHNSPNSEHYYLAVILRVFLRAGNLELTKALAKRYNINIQNDNLTYNSGQSGRINRIVLNELKSFIGNTNILNILKNLSIGLAKVYNINSGSNDSILESIEKSFNKRCEILTGLLRNLFKNYSLFFENKINITFLLNEIKNLKEEINNLKQNANDEQSAILFKVNQFLDSKVYSMALKFKDFDIKNENNLREGIETCLFLLKQAESHKYVKIARSSFENFINNGEYFQLANAVNYLNKYFDEVVDPIFLRDFKETLKKRNLSDKEVEEYLSMLYRESFLLPLYEIIGKIQLYLKDNIPLREREAIERHENILRFRQESGDEELRKELSKR